MKDIAREFGISVATVSRALKDSPRISEERRKAIQQYARDHNFYPNAIGEALRHSRVMPQRVIRICENFLRSKVCGVIVSQAKDTKDYAHYQKLIDAGIPLVFYDRICTGVNASRVVVDDYMGAYNAVTYLIETGCKRIAFYGSPMQLEISKNRYNGYKDALLKHGMSVDKNVVIVCDNRNDAEHITPSIMAIDNPPDGQRRYGNRYPLHREACGLPCA